MDSIETWGSKNYPIASLVFSVEGNRSIRSIGVFSRLLLSFAKRLLSSIAARPIAATPSPLSSDRIVFLKRRSLLLSERKRKLLGALRDSSQSEAVGASRACCFTEWSSGKKSTLLQVLGFVAC
ncbi:hypothetical protein F2Q68_00028012 [Brassica cretica]|uniref:Uncharacterized protein n=1 Tax=Brassica cretica TaxID=69181 RepID=A0A8S9IIT7_BRACR|nr:hypothetical protein F2Q68_00028012 [Brassica cretica]